MSSAAQTLANQHNSQHSTGPRTPQGKRQSSTNALRHGLTSQTVVLPTEDAAAYAAFRGEVFAGYEPDTVDERLLVQTICDTQWRLERAQTLETNLMQLAHLEEIPAHLAAIADPAQRQALITAHGYDKREKQIRNLQLQAARLQRTLLQAMDQLRTMQDERIDSRSGALTYAAQVRQACQSANLPFQPSDFGFAFTDEEIDREQTRNRVYQLVHPSPFARAQTPGQAT